MSQQIIHDVVILGSGPSGLTASIYAARANLKPTLFHGPQPGGQLTTTTDIENFPGFSKGIFAYDLIKEMEEQAKNFGTNIISKTVTKVDFSKKPFSLTLEDGEEVLTKTLIISTGAKANTLNLKREDEMMGYGLSACATCDGAFFREKKVVVIGGGDSACEESIFLTKFAKKVIVVLRRDEFRASKIMVDRVLNSPKIEVIYNHNAVELIGDRETRLKGIILEHSKTKEKKNLDCDGLFYAIGHTPNTSIFKDYLNIDKKGYIITEPDSTKTNIEGVFAAGDVQDSKYRQAITAAGSGCMAAIEVERYLSENE